MKQGTSTLKPILIVGSSNTDLIVSVERLPKEGETITGICLNKFSGGKGANQAVAAARAGARVSFAGAVGRDSFGDESVHAFQNDGLDLRFLRRTAEVPSGTALISVDRDGKNQIVVVPGANGLVSREHINAIDFSEFGLAVFQLEIPHETVWYGVHNAHEAGCVTILNPAPASRIPVDVLTRLDYLIPNEHELDVLSESTGSFEQKADEILNKGVKNVIVTLGAKGAVWISSERAVFVPAPRVPVVNTVGAGDCFIGVFAACLSKGQGVEQSIQYAIAAASLSVGKPGAQASYATWNDIQAFLDMTSLQS